MNAAMTQTWPCTAPDTVHSVVCTPGRTIWVSSNANKFIAHLSAKTDPAIG